MHYLPFPTLLSTTDTILLSLQILCKMSLARQLSTWRSLPDCSLVLSFISSAMFPGVTFFFIYFICFLLPVGCIPGPPRSIAHPLSGTHPCLFDIQAPPVSVLIPFTFPMDLSCRLTRLMPLRAWPNFLHLKVNLACVCLIS